MRVRVRVRVKIRVRVRASVGVRVGVRVRQRGAHRRPSACGEEQREEGRTGLLACTAGCGRAALRKRGGVIRDRAALGGGGGGGGGCGWRLEALVPVGVHVVEDL